jgi:hypothetical protein
MVMSGFFVSTFSEIARQFVKLLGVEDDASIRKNEGALTGAGDLII